MCKPFACIRTETAPYLLTLDIDGSTQPDHFSVVFTNLVDQLSNRLDRLQVEMQQDQDLNEASVAKLPFGYELRPQLDVFDGNRVLRLAFDPSRYTGHNLRLDAPRIVEAVRQSLASMTTEVGSA